MRKILVAAAVFALFLTACETELDPDSGPAHVHDYVYSVTAPSTCIAQGVETGICKLNHKHTTTRKLAINPGAHVWGAPNPATRTAATEKTNGSETVACSHHPAASAKRDLYATGTEGLEFNLITGGPYIDTYRVSKGEAVGDLFIPAFWRPEDSDDYDDYKPVISIGNGTNTLASNAFGGASTSAPNTSFTTLTFAADSQLKIIGDYAFSNCTGLTSVAIPEGLTYIGANVFNGCTALASVTLPEDLNVIANNMFSGCTGLSDIDIPEGVTSIGNSAFNNCTGLTVIDIPEGVTSIGDQAFYRTGLTSVTLPPSLTTLGSSVFNGLSLTSIVIPESVTTFGNNVFSGCTALASVTFAENSQLTTLGSQAFNGCTALTEIVIPEGVTSLSYTFNNCTNLASVILPQSLTYISSNVFTNCAKLTSIDIPDSVTMIYSYAFQGCVGLTGVTLPASLTRIDMSAFNGCTGLTSIVIPDSVTDICDGAFNNCTNLVSISFPANVSLSNNNDPPRAMFQNCNNLASVTFRGPIPTALYGRGYSDLGLPVISGGSALRSAFYRDDPAYGTPGTYIKKAAPDGWTREENT